MENPFKGRIKPKQGALLCSFIQPAHGLKWSPISSSDPSSLKKESALMIYVRAQTRPAEGLNFQVSKVLPRKKRTFVTIAATAGLL